MTSDKQIKHWYAKFNRAYFGGELPEHTVLFWDPPPGAHGNTCPVYEVDRGQFIIKLDPALKGVSDYWKLILLHEMIHLSLWEKHPKHQHGRLFQDEKDRVYALGALKKLW